MSKSSTRTKANENALKKMAWRAMILGLASLIALAAGVPAQAHEVTVWDTATNGWNGDLTQGKPIDTGAANCESNAAAVDANGVVYLAFTQKRSGTDRLFLNRYDGTGLTAWNSTTGWTADLSQASPLDKGTNSALTPEIAVGTDGKVYIGYVQSDNPIKMSIRLVRYDGTGITVWNHAQGWTADTSQADPLNRGDFDILTFRLAVDSAGMIYLAYGQRIDASTNRVHLGRCDGTTVEVWDQDGSDPGLTGPGWSADLTQGDHIGTGLAETGAGPELAINSGNKVYVTYRQRVGGPARVFLNRYDKASNKFAIWHQDAANPALSSWSEDFSRGAPIDNGSSRTAMNTRIAVTPDDTVFVSYSQPTASGVTHVHLSRFNGARVEIWDQDAATWSADLTQGDPVDGGSRFAELHQLAVDAGGRVYIAFTQNDNTRDCAYLSRYNGTRVEIWDQDAAAWSADLTQGDPVDIANGGDTEKLRVAAAGSMVYLAYSQPQASDGGVNSRICLSRFNGTGMETWDQDGSSGARGWTTSLAHGDPIGSNSEDVMNPRMVLNAAGQAFVTYVKSDGTNYRAYLNRYRDTSAATTPTSGGGGGGGGGGCFITTLFK